MKIFFLTFILLSGLAIADAYQSPDIVVISKLDADWSEVLISKLRNLIRNFNIVDPFKSNFPGNLPINESQLGDLLPPATKKLTGSLGNSLGLDFLKTELKVSISDLAYEVKGFKTDMKGSATTPEGFKMTTSLSAEEIFVEAGKLSLAIVIPSQKGKPVPVINIVVHKPIIKALDDKLVNVLAKIWMLDHKDSLSFKIEDLDLSQITSKLLTSGNLKLTYEKIDIPTISFKVGNKVIHFDPDKIRNYLHDHHEGLKGLLVAQVASYLKKGTYETAFKIVEKYRIPKSYWMPTPFIRSMVDVQKISSFPDTNDLLITVNGDFCAQDPYKAFLGECLFHKVTQTAPTRLTEDMYNKSIKVVRDIMLEKDFDMMASISEDYLNRMLASTIDAGLWNQPLQEAGISFGPKKMLLRLGAKGRAGTLILDGVYKTNTIERIGTGSSKIQFPLVLDVSFRIEKQECLPVLVVKVESVNTTDSVLLDGVKEFGFESNVRKIPRFKKNVLKAMRKSLVPFGGKDMFAIPIKELRNMSLQAADFRSDGMGRMIGSMKLEDLDLSEPESIPGQFPASGDPWATIPLGTKPSESRVSCPNP